MLEEKLRDPDKLVPGVRIKRCGVWQEESTVLSRPYEFKYSKAYGPCHSDMADYLVVLLQSTNGRVSEGFLGDMGVTPYSGNRYNKKNWTVILPDPKDEEIESLTESLRTALFDLNEKSEQLNRVRDLLRAALRM